MTVYDLIFKAGGLDDSIFKGNTFMRRADLIRYDKNSSLKKIIPIDLDSILKNKEFEHNVILKPNDLIRIYPKEIFTSKHSVSIDGVVINQGTYDFMEGMTVKDLILEAGGIADDVYNYKVEIARVDPDKLDADTFAEIIQVDMDKDYSIRDYAYNINNHNGSIEILRDEFKLMPYDYVSIRPDPYFGMQKKINIEGSVYFPGTYAILSPNETISDIIDRAGGLLPQAYPIASTFTRQGQSVKIDIRKVIKRPRSRENIFVQDNDSILLKTIFFKLLARLVLQVFINFQRDCE